MKSLVGDVRAGLAELFTLPDGYEVVLGNGGSTTFWDVAVSSLIERRSAHASFGEFSAKFAAAAAAAPFLEEPGVVTAPVGSVAVPTAVPGADVYAWAHNETSTGAIAPVRRVEGVDEGALVVVDGTSAAGGVELDVSQTDVYYFAPQKSFGSEGGLWFALLSPAAVDRVGRVAASGRWIPESLSLATALANSRLDQTLNTPAIATLFLMRDQLRWLLDRGGLAGRGGPDRGLRQPDLPLGRAGAVRRRVRHRPGPPLPGGRHHRLRGRGRGEARGDPAGERRGRHRAVPQARPQPAAGRHVPERRSRRRQPAVRLHRLAGPAAGLTRRVGPGVAETVRRRTTATTTPATTATTAARPTAR